jgi:hypothetical protein
LALFAIDDVHEFDDLLVGRMLAEQPDDDGADVLVARPAQPFQVVDRGPPKYPPCGVRSRS